MLGYAVFVLSLSVLLPYIVLAQAALAKAWGRGFSLDNLTLHNFTYLLFEHETAGQSVINSFTYAAAAACIAHDAGPVDRLHRQPSPAALRRRARASSPWRRSSCPASCWRSPSTPPTRRRRLRCMAPRRS